MRSNPFYTGDYVKATYASGNFQGCTGRVKTVLEEGRAYDVWVGVLGLLPFASVLKLPTVRFSWEDLTILKTHKGDFDMTLDRALWEMKHKPQ